MTSNWVKYPSYEIIVLIVLAGVYFGFLNREKAEQSGQETIQEMIRLNTTQIWETKTDEQLPVTIKVTPVEFGKDVNLWKFDIAFDTHSGSLDQDVLQIATLEDDKGNVYKPTDWEGPGPGGHHLEGILVFRPISPKPASIELKIKDIGGVSERSFKWNLE